MAGKTFERRPLADCLLPAVGPGLVDDLGRLASGLAEEFLDLDLLLGELLGREGKNLAGADRGGHLGGGGAGVVEPYDRIVDLPTAIHRAGHLRQRDDRVFVGHLHERLPLLLSANLAVKLAGHLAWRWLERADADIHDLESQAQGIDPALNPLLEFRAALGASLGEQFVERLAGKVGARLLLGDQFDRFTGGGRALEKRDKVADAILHDHVGHEQRERATAAGSGFRRAEKQLESHFRGVVVTPRPEQALPLVLKAAQLVAGNCQLEHFASGVDFGGLDGPWCLEMDSRADRSAGERAVPQHDPLLVGPDDHKAAECEEHTTGEDRQWRHRAAEQLIEPAAGDLDPELVVDQFSDHMAERFRRREQAEESAVERWPRNLARPLGPVGREQGCEQDFAADQNHHRGHEPGQQFEE